MPSGMLKAIGGILAATITVVDEASERSLTGHCMLEGGRGQLTEQVLPAGVSNAAARTAIESKGQIKPALLGLDVGDIALPELARAIRRRHLCQPVFCDLVIMAAVSGARRKRRFCRARMPLSRISLATRFLPQRWPSSRRSSRTRGLP